MNTPTTPSAVQVPTRPDTPPPTRPPRARGPALAVAAALAALVGCGGGEILAVLGFLGTGGGQYYLDGADPGFQPVDCGGSPCALTISIDAPVDPNTGVVPDVFFGNGYAIRANGPALPNCSNVTGRVEGKRVLLGNCFTGEYVSVNQLRSDDGRTSYFYDYFPRMEVGVWVDIHDAGRRYKFTSNAAGCETVGGVRRSFTSNIVASNYGTVAFAPATTLVPATRIASVAVQGGETFSGEFVGASAMRLTSASRTIELERRNETATCS